jgi:hypothetical protein
VSTYLSELANLGLLWAGSRAAPVRRRRPLPVSAAEVSGVEAAP